MSIRRNKITAVIGAIIVSVTLVVFFMITENREKIDWTGLIFILAAEIGLFGGLIGADIEAGRSSSLMLRSGAYSVLGIYAVTATSLSILFMSVSSLREHIKLFVAAQIILIAVAAAILLLLIASSRSVSEKHSAAEQSVSKMQAFIGRVLAMKEDPKNSAYAASLSEIYETMKYSDASASLTGDDMISQKIAELETLLSSEADGKGEKASSIMDDILSLLKQRSAEMKISKHGRL